MLRSLKGVRESPPTISSPLPVPSPAHRVCIYCRDSKPDDEFNREHVVPEGFGGFTGAPVLDGSVCEACNTYFGATLDLKLARGTDEGFQRYVYEVRPRNEIERFRYDALTFRFDGPGDFHGCFLRLTADANAPNGFRATPIDQVGFALRTGDGFEWIRLHEVLGGAWRTRDDLDAGRGVRIYAADPEAVKSYLEAEGFAFPNWRPMVRKGDPGDEAPVVQIAQITPELRRVVAKIAFNYLAWVHDSKFVLRDQFDTIRNFIRYGLGGDDLIGVDNESPIALPPGASVQQRPVIHVVTVERAINAPALLGQVMLFGGLRYQVVLSEDGADDFRFSGHSFNVATLRAARLGNRRQSDGASEGPL